MKPELVAAIFGASLAVLAGLFKLFRNVKSRKLERYSVQPSLQIDRVIQSEQPIRIILRSTGKGPALLTTLRL